MKHTKLIYSNLKKNVATYFYDEFLEMVFRFEPLINTHKVYAKQKGKLEYVIDKTGDLAMEIESSGIIINKAKYEEY